MKYAKLIDNALQFAPKVLRVDGKTMINPNGETLKQYGYFPLGESIMPMAEEGCEVIATGYEVKDGFIIRTWEQVPKPVPTEEELAEMRRHAYVTECDPLSMAYIGYMLEGDEAKAMSARASYLKAKAEIRKRFKEA